MAENITLANLANLQNETTAVNTINNNNAVITTAFTDVLSRSGVSPNTMGAPLDMNNNPILNLPTPGTANSPARLIDVTSTNPINISLSLTGDVTAPTSSGVLTATIPANTVTNSKLATMPALTVKSNLTGGVANAADNSPSAVLDSVQGTSQGTVGFRGASTWQGLGPGTSGQLLQSGGPGANPSWITAASTPATIKVQKFLTSGTYTPSANMQSVIIECIGGGGAGGGVFGAINRFIGGGGGGSGGYSRAYATAATIGSSQTVTIGAGGTGIVGNGPSGGTTSLGAICIANGGSGGQQNDATVNFGNGGQGGTPGTGDITATGTAGSQGTSSITNFACSGYGGASFIGGAPAPFATGGGTFVGAAAPANSGCGGTGAITGNNASNAAGGNGGSGLVIISEVIF